MRLFLEDFLLLDFLQQKYVYFSSSHKFLHENLTFTQLFICKAFFYTTFYMKILLLHDFL